MNTINILIADGRKLLREGLSVLLERHADLRVVGDASEIAAVPRLVEPLDVNVLVVNLSPLAPGSVDLLRRVIAQQPSFRVVALVLTPTADVIRQLLSAGVSGCLTKECTSDELVTAIRTAMNGGTYLSPALTQLMLNGYVRAAADRNSGASRALAPREREVLRRIASGENTKEIAHALGIGTKTVETHRRRLMQKLGRDSVAELTQYAVIEGLIQLGASVEV